MDDLASEGPMILVLQLDSVQEVSSGRNTSRPLVCHRFLWGSDETHKEPSGYDYQPTRWLRR